MESGPGLAMFAPVVRKKARFFAACTRPWQLDMVSCNTPAMSNWLRIRLPRGQDAGYLWSGSCLYNKYG